MEKTKISKLTYFYILSFVVLFVAIAAFVIIYVTKAFDYKELDDLKEITVEEALTLHINSSGTQTAYYVLIIDENSKYNDKIEEKVVEYANLVKNADEDSKLANIYVLKYTSTNASQIYEITTKAEKIESCPLLIKVSSKKASTTDTTTSAINDRLNDLIVDYNKE